MDKYSCSNFFDGSFTDNSGELLVGESASDGLLSWSLTPLSPALLSGSEFALAAKDLYIGGSFVELMLMLVALIGVAPAGRIRAKVIYMYQNRHSYIMKKENEL